ncbi:MAG: ABC transporter permease [Phycisphaerae bacterium]|nr:ABC transporter permease [Phycisphaerae bacterium]
MSHFYTDLKYAFRTIRRNPGFTAIAILILAVAIAATTSLFSVVNAVLLRPLPYKDSHELVWIRQSGLDRTEMFRYRPNFFTLREHNNVFESVAGVCGLALYVHGIETPHQVFGTDVTANFFSLLGVQPNQGRGFGPDDETPESPRVVVVSHDFWRDDLGADPNVIGRTLILANPRVNESYRFGSLDTDTHTIVGVMPPGFTFLGKSVQLWRAMIFPEGPARPYDPPVIPLARLKKGVTPERASADLTVLASRLRRTESVDTAPHVVEVTRFLDSLVRHHRRLPLLLLGAAGFVLLIACANVANLFLARATARQHEMAMRMALGAGRARLMRQMLTESLLVSLAAGVLGLVLTFCTVKGLVALCPADIPRLQETNIDLRVLGFTLGISLLTGLLFGLVPAWRASDIGVNETLKQGTGRGCTRGGRRWHRLHDGLVVSQLGCSLILLIGAALLIRTLVALHAVELGFQPQNLLAVGFDLPWAKYMETDQCNHFFKPLLERIQNLPSVRSVGSHDGSIFSSPDAGGRNFTIAGQAGPGQSRSARWMSVTPGFFDVVGMRWLAGRAFDNSDPDAIVIDETLAHECFPGSDPLGQTFLTDDSSGQKTHTIVGVVDTIRCFDAPGPVVGTIYTQVTEYAQWMAVLVRTDGDPMRLVPAIREIVSGLEKDKVISEMTPMEEKLSGMLVYRRFVMTLLGIFAGIALALATIGIYGLLQYSTTRQTRDIGIRMALGARRVDVLTAVMGQGLKLILIGIAVGVAGAVALTRVLTSLLYDVTPTDPVTLAVVSGTLMVVAMLASFLPARRAAKVDPMVALRYE